MCSLAGPYSLVDIQRDYAENSSLKDVHNILILLYYNSLLNSIELHKYGYNIAVYSDTTQILFRKEYFHDSLLPVLFLNIEYDDATGTVIDDYFVNTLLQLCDGNRPLEDLSVCVNCSIETIRKVLLSCPDILFHRF